jgi:adenylylsulfate kinase-like enzyme
VVIWLCGLSGAGKSTIGAAVYARLKAQRPNLVMLDGDELRDALGGSIGHDPNSRILNSIRIANLCHLLDRQGIDVICCAVTIAPDAQKSNRERLSYYREVYLKVSLDVLKGRDPKGIYERAMRGETLNVAGVDIPFIEPETPHIEIDNNHDTDDVSAIVDRIVENLPAHAA